MRDKPAGNLLAYLRHNCEVVCREVLVALLVGHFEAAYGVIAELDWDEEGVADHLVQSFIDSNVVAKFFADVFTLHLAEVLGLPGVEDAADYVVGFPLERDWLAETACYHLAEEVIFEPVIQKDRAPFHIEEVRQNFDQAWQVELKLVVEADVLGDVKQCQSVLDSLAGQ